MTDAASETLRDRLIEATLPHVPFDGWTLTALSRGAAALEISAAIAENAFPEGAADLVGHFVDLADRRMLEALASRNLALLKVRERIQTAIRLRLEAVAPHREAVKRAVGFLALPPYLGLAFKLLYRTVDAIWYAAGDTATDYNFYTKRALLAGVYAATLMYWLEDRSPGQADSWAFLERRLADVMKVPQTFGRIGRLFTELPDALRRVRRAAGRSR
ncbi:MAG: COQ9 family protein [Proteobacteria bacterium]|nr:COQ9 family protein [Pseudomonadota bacterium]